MHTTLFSYPAKDFKNKTTLKFNMMLRSLLVFLAVLASSIMTVRGEYSKLVYVLPLGEEIDALTWRYTRQALREAEEKRADIFVVDLNTYGGALQDADSIRTALLRCRIPTVALVDHNAASAGALIALACDSVYMTNGSSMGAATVVDGTGTPLPDKYQSYMRSMMRATAEAHGKRLNKSDSTMGWIRHPRIAESMVDPRVAVPGLIDSTKVLTFTASEAVEWGYAEGIATSLDDMLSQIGLEKGSYEVAYFTPTLSDKILGFLGRAGVQAMLISIIVAGLFLELKTPGIGFAGAAAVVAAVLYFLPMCITGTVSGWVIVLFIVGIVAFALEIFVIPGFGIAGIGGGLAVIVAVVVALVQKEAVMGVTLSDISYACMIFFISLVMASALLWWLTSKYGPSFLHRSVALTQSQDVEEGYIGVDMDSARYVGQEAETLTDLRPSGKILLDGKSHDAVSTSGFIEAGKKVMIYKYENAQLYVKNL